MRYIFTPLLFVLTLTLSAQVQYGTITYLQTNEMVWESENEVETPQDKQIREMMAKMQAGGAFNKTYKATFSPDAFNCKEEMKDPAEMSMESGGATIVVMTGDEDPAHYYSDLKSGEVLNTEYIFDKGFLVSGKPKPVEWTLTGEKIAPSEMTAGLDLLLAVGITELNDTITAGYAPSLPANVGPLNYYGLPGAIITLEIPNGKQKTIFRATNIEISPSVLKVSQPTEGKPISMEKYREQKEKREKAMKREFRH